MTKPKTFSQNIVRRFRIGSSTGSQNEEDLERIAAHEQKLFSFESLVAATKDFHVTHRLGEGGFGPVFRGKLNDGREIAVKKLSQTSNQGKKEFQNEAKLLARVQHRNVVNLLGYCVHGVEKLLVYEYVANESIDKYIFKSSKKEQLDWKRRYDIITGIARGLLYLHEDLHSCIIHRDIKASNVLLDDKWVPKIADFGMARLFPEDQMHINTRVAGTNGYMAPEYVMYGHLSAKADVFSFGVLVLELISSKRNSTFNQQCDAQNLLEWAYKLHKKDRGLEMLDQTLASPPDSEQVKACIHIGLLCTQSDPRSRPTMQRVVDWLSKKPSNLDEPGRPGLPGSSYRRSHRPPGMSPGMSWTAGSSGDSDSRTYDSSTFAPNTASASTPLTSSGVDPHGKRPMQS